MKVKSEQTERVVKKGAMQIPGGEQTKQEITIAKVLR